MLKVEKICWLVSLNTCCGVVASPMLGRTVPVRSYSNTSTRGRSGQTSAILGVKGMARRRRRREHRCFGAIRRESLFGLTIGRRKGHYWHKESSPMLEREGRRRCSTASPSMLSCRKTEKSAGTSRQSNIGVSLCVCVCVFSRYLGRIRSFQASSDTGRRRTSSVSPSKLFERGG